MRSSSIASTIFIVAGLSAGCDSAGGPPIPLPPDDNVDSVQPAPTVPIFAPGTQQVLVTNTASQPVPTQAVGTTTVDGAVAASQAGTWTMNVGGGTVGAQQFGNWSVSASQLGSWNVDVNSLPPVALAPGANVSVGSLPPVTLAGTPAVTIANTPAVTIANMPNVAVSGTVAIANTEDDEAVPVRVVGGGGAGPGTQTPWVGGGQVIINIGEPYDSEQFYAPPPGKRLVIEYMTVEVTVPAGQTAFQATLLASAAGVGQTLKFPLQPVPDGLSTHDTFSTVQNMKVNISGGVIVAVTRSATTGAAIANVALSGYLVDAPAP